MEILQGNLSIPGEVLKKCFYVETVLFECWGATVGTYSIDNVLFADAVMRHRKC